MKSIFTVTLLMQLFFVSCLDHNRIGVNSTILTDSINFGNITSKDTFSTEVVIRNNSARILRILHVENGCGCTTGFIKDSTVASNDSTSIRISYIPSLTKDSGKVIKYITVRTNADPPFKNIVIKGEVH